MLRRPTGPKLLRRQRARPRQGRSRLDSPAARSSSATQNRIWLERPRSPGERRSRQWRPTRPLQGQKIQVAGATLHANVAIAVMSVGLDDAAWLARNRRRPSGRDSRSTNEQALRHSILGVQADSLGDRPGLQRPDLPLDLNGRPAPIDGGFALFQLPRVGHTLRRLGTGLQRVTCETLQRLEQQGGTQGRKPFAQAEAGILAVDRDLSLQQYRSGVEPLLHE